MARCATCDTNLLIVLNGKVNIGDLRYCSESCASKDFFAKFQAGREAAAAANPNPFPDLEPLTQSDAQDDDAIDFPDANDGRGGLGVIAPGLATIAVVVLLIRALHAVVDYPFFAFTFWVVFPVGAFLCGMAAGCGFWLALRKFQRRPSGSTYLAASLGGVCGYILIFFLMWWQLDVQGVRVRDMVSFPEYIQHVIENQRIRIGRGGNPIDLGKWGYAQFVLNLVGFALGVVAMVAIAGSKAYCPKCKRYYVTVGKQSRSTSFPEGAGASLYLVIAAVVSGRLQQALDIHADSAHQENGYLTTTIKLESCPECGMQLATLTASTPGGLVENFTYAGQTTRPVSLRG